MAGTQTMNTADDCVDALIERVGPHITIGLALGIGKPVKQNRVGRHPAPPVTCFSFHCTVTAACPSARACDR